MTSPKWRWNYDLACVIADREGGKTTLALDLCKNIPKGKIIVLNSNYEPKYKEIAGKIVKPQFYTTETLDKFIKYLRSHVNALGIIDDIDLYKPQYSMQLESLAINGRHQNIGLIILSRRIIGLPKTFLQCVDLLYMANTRGQSDLDTLEQYFDPTQNHAKGLEKFKFARWSKKDSDNVTIVESGKSL